MYSFNRLRKQQRLEREAGSAYDYVDYNEIKTSSAHEGSSNIHALNRVPAPCLPNRGEHALKVTEYK